MQQIKRDFVFVQINQKIQKNLNAKIYENTSENVRVEVHRVTTTINIRSSTIKPL